MSLLEARLAELETMSPAQLHHKDCIAMIAMTRLGFKFPQEARGTVMAMECGTSFIDQFADNAPTLSTGVFATVAELPYDASPVPLPFAAETGVNNALIQIVHLSSPCPAALRRREETDY